MPPETTKDPRIIGYNAVRRALGFIGLGLPLSLGIYAVIVEDGMQPSISEFYYTSMRDVLVGSLCAIGVFLIAYKGFPREPGEKLNDWLLATVAGAGAIGVALFPTTYKGGTLCGGELCFYTGISNHPDWYHFVSAAVFFVCLALFCFFLFPKGERKRGTSLFGSRASSIYFVCGCLIVFSILAMVLYWRVSQETRTVLRGYNYIFWFEALGIVAFAVSWLTKGKIRAGIRALGGQTSA